jgi:enoyl-CoA hydratase/carnithine racemase
MPDILYEKFDRYAIITLNRPERLNALGGAMREEIREAVADISADPNIRAGILTGTGRAFSAGADLKERVEQQAAGRPKPVVTFETGAYFSPSPKPFIAAVNGLAVGGGVERAMDCDIIIASTNAYFTFKEATRGTLAGYAIHHLPRNINAGQANYMLLTSDEISAEQAKQFGLVNEVVAPERLMPRAIEIAELIAQNAPLSIEGTKAAIRAWRMANVDFSYRLSEWIYRANVDTSEDIKEGARAFAERRKPNWQGR